MLRPDQHLGARRRREGRLTGEPGRHGRDPVRMGVRGDEPLAAARASTGGGVHRGRREDSAPRRRRRRELARRKPPFPDDARLSSPVRGSRLARRADSGRECVPRRALGRVRAPFGDPRRAVRRFSRRRDEREKRRRRRREEPDAEKNASARGARHARRARPSVRHARPRGVRRRGGDAPRSRVLVAAGQQRARVHARRRVPRRDGGRHSRPPARRGTWLFRRRLRRRRRRRRARRARRKRRRRDALVSARRVRERAGDAGCGGCVVVDARAERGEARRAVTAFRRRERVAGGQRAFPGDVDGRRLRIRAARHGGLARGARRVPRFRVVDAVDTNAAANVSPPRFSESFRSWITAKRALRDAR